LSPALCQHFFPAPPVESGTEPSSAAMITAIR